MRIWHCETQEQYDYLMEQLEAEGCNWPSGEEPTHRKGLWVSVYEERTCIVEDEGKLLYGSIDYCEKEYPGIEIQSVVIPGDKINMPHHYVGRQGLEAIEVVRNFSTPEQEAGFYYGNAIKYLTRYQRKNGVEDLKKARKNLDWLIELLEEAKQ